MIYCRPFRLALHYMQLKHPSWDLSDFQDKLFYSEKYFNMMLLDQNYEREKAYIDFKVFLNGHCLVFPTQFITYHNMVQLHFVFEQYKIAINFHLNKFTRPFDCQPSQMQKLPATILKHEGWEVYELTEKEFNSWTYDQRVNNIKDWLRQAKIRQAEKGVIPKVPIEYV